MRSLLDPAFHNDSTNTTRKHMNKNLKPIVLRSQLLFPVGSRR